MLVTDFATEVDEYERKDLLKDLASILNLADPIEDFVGSHPVTLSHDTLDTLLNEDYLVCEKSDGIRLILIVLNGKIFFYDRKNRFYQTDLYFNTPLYFILDGEMYKEEEKYVFALFDTLAFDSKLTLCQNLNQRLWFCFQFEKIFKKGYIQRKPSGKLNFDIIGKMMFKSYAFSDILKNISKLKHENDGLIFTPVNEPYLLFTRSKIFKWKPAHLNTIDFLLKRAEKAFIYTLHCTLSDQQARIVCGRGYYGSTLFFDYYFDENSVDLDGKIGEFCYDPEKEVIDMSDLTVKKGGWILHRVRTDKDLPNNIKVVIDTLDSLKSSVSELDIENIKDNMRDRYKQRNLIQQQK